MTTTIGIQLEGWKTAINPLADRLYLKGKLRID